MVPTNKYRNPLTRGLSFVLFCIALAYPQTERWVYQYNGPGDGEDRAYSMVYGADGNIYTAGYSTGIGTGKDFTAISLKATGDTNWIYRYNGPGNGNDAAHSIVYGLDGNIYVAGYSLGISTGDDLTVISLTADGDTNWIYRYNGTGNGNDGAYSIVYGADGNIYAGGYSKSLNTCADFFVVSLTVNGETNWTYRYYRYSGPYYDGGNAAKALTYGANGNIYAAGYTSGYFTIWDFTVISIDTTGVQRWVYYRDGANLGSDVANSIVCGADGQIYAAGFLMDAYFVFTVISFDTAGIERWIYHYVGPPGFYGDNYGYCIAYGLDGTLYASGSSQGSGTGYDFTVINLTTIGDTNWVYRYNGPGNGNDGANAIAYGADNNIYAAGNSYGNSTGDDFTAISLTTDGDTNWVYRYNGPGDSADVATGIVYGADSNVYVAGYSTGNGTGNDFTVISLNPTSGIEEQLPSGEPEGTVRIISTFFNKEINIGFTNSPEVPLKITLYNILGARVYETSFATTPLYVCLTDKAIARLSKGIYFLSISQGDKSDIVTKIIKP